MTTDRVEHFFNMKVDAELFWSGSDDAATTPYEVEVSMKEVQPTGGGHGSKR